MNLRTEETACDCSAQSDSSAPTTHQQTPDISHNIYKSSIVPNLLKYPQRHAVLKDGGYEEEITSHCVRIFLLRSPPAGVDHAATYRAFYKLHHQTLTAELHLKGDCKFASTQR